MSTYCANCESSALNKRLNVLSKTKRIEASDRELDILKRSKRKCIESSVDFLDAGNVANLLKCMPPNAARRIFIDTVTV